MNRRVHISFEYKLFSLILFAFLGDIMLWRAKAPSRGQVLRNVHKSAHRNTVSSQKNGHTIMYKPP